MEQQIIHLATLANERFRFGLAVLLRSALGKLDPGATLSVHVLDMGLSVESRRKICQTLKNADQRSEIRFLPWQECSSSSKMKTRLRSLGLSGLVTSYFGKMVLFEELKELPWCLFLDADIYVNRDLGGLPFDALSDFPLAAVSDEGMAPFVAKGEVPEFRAMKLDAAAPNFNAGVMLLDLEHWREHQFVDRAIETAAVLKAWVPDNPLLNWRLTDQSVFNVLYYSNWAMLPSHWNRQCPADLGIFAELREGKERLLHYLVSPKPWEMPLSDGTQPFFDCLDQTAFAGWRPVCGWIHVKRKLSYWKYRYYNWRQAMRRNRAELRGGHR